MLAPDCGRDGYTCVVNEQAFRLQFNAAFAWWDVPAVSGPAFRSTMATN